MLRSTPVLACALLLACGSQPASTPATATTTAAATAPSPAATAELRAEIEAAYAGYARACMANDIAGVMSLLTDDVEWHLADGTVQLRPEIEPSMKQFLASIPPGAKIYFTLDQLTADSPDRAVAEAVFHLDAQDQHVTVGWHDTWVKGPTGWQNSVGIEKPPSK